MTNIFDIIEGFMDYNEIAKEIVILRKSKNITQKKLAEDLHISRATLSSFENGKMGDIGFKKVLQIIDYFGYQIVLKENSPFPSFEDILNG